MFADRNDAADQLDRAVAPLRGQHPLVLAIARAAVPMGRVIAQAPTLVRPLTEEVACLQLPRHFQAFGSLCRDFLRVGDEEVVALARSSSAQAATAGRCTGARTRRSSSRTGLAGVRKVRRAGGGGIGCVARCGLGCLGAASRAVLPGTNRLRPGNRVLVR